MSLGISVALGWVLACGIVFGGGPLSHENRSRPAQIDLQDLLRRMAEKEHARRAELRDYTCLRRYALRNEKFNVTGEMTVRLTYRQPGRLAFEFLSERGPAPVRKRVLRQMLAAEVEASQDTIRSTTNITAENYTFQNVDTTEEGGRTCHVLIVEPRVPSRFLIRGRIWVDAEDLAIVRIEATPARSLSFWIRRTTIVHRYKKFGDFWLPVANISETNARFFGPTTVTIDYSDYRINQDAADRSSTSATRRQKQAPIESQPMLSEPRSAEFRDTCPDVQY